MTYHRESKMPYLVCDNEDQWYRFPSDWSLVDSQIRNVLKRQVVKKACLVAMIDSKNRIHQINTYPITWVSLEEPPTSLIDSNEESE